MERPSEFIECGDFVLRRRRGESDAAAACRLIEESLEHLRPWTEWVAAGSGVDVVWRLQRPTAAGESR
ncbi:hypothetical protein ACQB60_21360 [Actinomycetota bacterium Odt1-20B]